MGASPLGLGLPVDVSTHTDCFETHLVGRPGRPHPSYFYKTVFRRSGQSEPMRQIPVASYSCPHLDELPAELEAALQEAELVLITVSMREKVAQRLPLILRIPTVCPTTAEVIFIACENKLSDAHRALIDVLPSKVHHLRTIVDRVCTWPNLPNPDSQPPLPRHVVHHEVGEWIIEEPSW